MCQFSFRFWKIKSFVFWILVNFVSMIFCRECSRYDRLRQLVDRKVMKTSCVRKKKKNLFKSTIQRIRHCTKCLEWLFIMIHPSFHPEEHPPRMAILALVPRIKRPHLANNNNRVYWAVRFKLETIRKWLPTASDSKLVPQSLRDRESGPVDRMVGWMATLLTPLRKSRLTLDDPRGWVWWDCWLMQVFFFFC